MIALKIVRMTKTKSINLDNPIQSILSFYFPRAYHASYVIVAINIHTHEPTLCYSIQSFMTITDHKLITSDRKINIELRRQFNQYK